MTTQADIVIPEGSSDDDVNALWASEVEPLLASNPGAVRIVLPPARSLTLAQLSAIVAISNRVRASGGTVSFDPEGPRLASMIRAFGRRAVAPRSSGRVGFIEQLGQSAIATAHTGVSILGFVAHLVAAVASTIRHPATMRWRDFFAAAAASSADALPVTALLCFIVGFIIAFQTMPSFAQFGMPAMTGIVIGVSMVRELGPLITAIILSGRSGSAFAAELGTMTVTNEIDALRALDLEPVRFLVVPRVLAVAVVTPLLSILGTIAGLLGGYLVLWEKDITFLFFYEQLKNAVHPHDFLQAVFKMLVFSLLVGSAGCLAGLQTAEGPGAVGRSATRAVVAGIVLVIVADGVMGAVFYAIGW